MPINLAKTKQKNIYITHWDTNNCKFY